MEGKLVWKGRMLFEGQTNVTGKTVLIDAHPEHGGQGVAATPMEHLLLAVAGCTALDVVAILRKMKQDLREYWVEVHAERYPEHPHRFTKVVIIHHFKGNNLDPQALTKAVQLSDEKYCSASATLRMATEVESRFVMDTP